ncbi:hypothetical protein [Deinococcus enclensis]|uniref:Intracellular proteinase inhibitor BsuPI domain-containing protein n=1 Tax=Deinococcus enclensis TaxID=1049582 RepID=A0ABT9MF77_9DEIO|nr:hypothetical protein [Deinococcus enclensis]MDP9765205.1 hypothetical protein [Deinococcus enclensis]
MARLNLDQRNAEIARRASAYGGMYTENGRLHVVVTSMIPFDQAAAVRELFTVLGRDLRARGFTPESVVFVPGEFNALDLLRAKEAALRFDGWMSVDIDAAVNRVFLAVQFPEMEAVAPAFFAEQGLPEGIVVTSGPYRSLHVGPELREPHQARLVLPARIAQGDVLPITLEVTNTGHEPLRLAFGACALRMEVRHAQTGEVVRPVSSEEACEDSAVIRVLPPRTALPFVVQEWNLQTPRGRVLPPGRYVVAVTLAVGTGPAPEVIQPPPQAFEVLPGDPRTGTAQVKDMLGGGRHGIDHSVLLGQEGGRQVVIVIVPDARAETALRQVLMDRGVPADRVRFQHLRAVRVPGSGVGEATLSLTTWPSPGARQHRFSLEADLTPWVARGAWRCQLVVNVLDADGEIVSGSPGFPSSPGFRSCREGPDVRAFPWRGNWVERRSDGSAVPPGTYSIRAGLRLTMRDGTVQWLLAPPQPLVVP